MLYLTQVEKYQKKSTLVFAADVKHINDLVKAFRDQGIDARGVSGATKSYDRSQLIYDFKCGKFPVLVNCAILTEGTDIPPVDCIMLARPTKSAVLLQQMLGRGLRLSEGKEFCLVLDFEDSINHGMRKANVPSLLGLNRDFSANGKRASDLIQYVKKVPQDSTVLYEKVHAAKSTEEIENILENAMNGSNLNLSIERFVDPFGIEALEAEKQFISSLSQFAWVRVQSNIWALNLSDEILIIKDNNDGLYEGLSRRKYKKTVQIFTHDSFKSAVGCANTYIIEKVGYMRSKKFQLSATWRKLPVSEDQRQLLQKWNIDKWIAKMTRGEASDLLLKRSLGAVGDARKVKKQKVPQREF